MPSLQMCIRDSNMICEFLGANWYALVATAGLAALFVIHIIVVAIDTSVTIVIIVTIKK